ncbi:hypothetical protein BT69DRAFT_1319887 [Atractiella rhizophila]|nr:hypothetical protein BT69DRAFT_1319887 [Atractiella rhizophila]
MAQPWLLRCWVANCEHRYLGRRDQDVRRHVTLVHPDYRPENAVPGAFPEDQANRPNEANFEVPAEQNGLREWDEDIVMRNHEIDPAVGWDEVEERFQPLPELENEEDGWCARAVQRKLVPGGKELFCSEPDKFDSGWLTHCLIKWEDSISGKDRADSLLFVACTRQDFEGIVEVVHGTIGRVVNREHGYLGRRDQDVRRHVTLAHPDYRPENAVPSAFPEDQANRPNEANFEVPMEQNGLREWDEDIVMRNREIDPAVGWDEVEERFQPLQGLRMKRIVRKLVPGGRRFRKDGTPALYDDGPEPDPLEQANQKNNGWWPFEDKRQRDAGMLILNSNGVVLSVERTKEYLDFLEEHFNYRPIQDRQKLFDLISQVPGAEDFTWHKTVVTVNVDEIRDRFRDGELPGYMQEMYVVRHRNLKNVLMRTLGARGLNGPIKYQAFIDIDVEGKEVYSSMASAKVWRRYQRLLGSDETIMPLKVASDNTLLAAQKGGAEFYPIYVLPGNIDEDVAYLHHLRYFMLVAGVPLIRNPLQELEETWLFARCPDGYYRHFFPPIVAHFADYMEKVFLALLFDGWCDCCLVDPSDKGKDDQWPLRDESQCRDALVAGWSEARLKQAGLRPLLPYTDNLRLTDMHSILVSDILHQLLKGTFLHYIVQWILALIEIERQEHGGPGILELERCLKFMPAFPGIRGFYMGLNFSRWSAGDAQQLAAIFAPAIYGLVPTPALRWTVALLEFVYFANLPVFGNEEHGKEKGFDNIPKIQAFHHYDDDIVNVESVTFLSTERRIWRMWVCFQMRLLDLVEHAMSIMGAILEFHGNKLLRKDIRCPCSKQSRKSAFSTFVITSDAFSSHWQLGVTAVWRNLAAPTKNRPLLKYFTRAKDSWYSRDVPEANDKAFERFDCVVIRETRAAANRPFHPAQVLLFFSLEFEGKEHQLAFVQYFNLVGHDIDRTTRMWKLKIAEGSVNRVPVREVEVIPIERIIRPAHVTPVFKTETPRDQNRSNILDSHREAWLSKFSDQDAFLRLLENYALLQRFL